MQLLLRQHCPYKDPLHTDPRAQTLQKERNHASTRQPTKPGLDNVVAMRRCSRMGFLNGGHVSFQSALLPEAEQLLVPVI